MCWMMKAVEVWTSICKHWTVVVDSGQKYTAGYTVYFSMVPHLAVNFQLTQSWIDHFKIHWSQSFRIVSNRFMIKHSNVGRKYLICREYLPYLSLRQRRPISVQFLQCYFNNVKSKTTISRRICLSRRLGSQDLVSSQSTTWLRQSCSLESTKDLQITPTITKQTGSSNQTAGLGLFSRWEMTPALLWVAEGKKMLPVLFKPCLIIITNRFL